MNCHIFTCICNVFVVLLITSLYTKGNVLLRAGEMEIKFLLKTNLYIQDLDYNIMDEIQLSSVYKVQCCY